MFTFTFFLTLILFLLAIGFGIATLFALAFDKPKAQNFYQLALWSIIACAAVARASGHMIVDNFPFVRLFHIIERSSISYELV